MTHAARLSVARCSTSSRDCAGSRVADRAPAPGPAAPAPGLAPAGGLDTSEAVPEGVPGGLSRERSPLVPWLICCFSSHCSSLRGPRQNVSCVEQTARLSSLAGGLTPAWRTRCSVTNGSKDSARGQGMTLGSKKARPHTYVSPWEAQGRAGCGSTPDARPLSRLDVHTVPIMLANADTHTHTSRQSPCSHNR